MNFSSLVAARLIEERKRLYPSQAEAAAACGVSREMWGKYERGVAAIGGEVLFLFAAAGADVNYILTGERSMKAVPQPPLDTALLRDCIQVLTEGFANRRRKPSPAQMAEAILLAYEIARGDGKVMKEKFEPILRLVA